MLRYALPRAIPQNFIHNRHRLKQGVRSVFSPSAICSEPVVAVSPPESVRRCQNWEDAPRFGGFLFDVVVGCSRGVDGVYRKLNGGRMKGLSPSLRRDRQFPGSEPPKSRCCLWHDRDQSCSMASPLSVTGSVERVLKNDVPGASVVQPPQGYAARVPSGEARVFSGEGLRMSRTIWKIGWTVDRPLRNASLPGPRCGISLPAGISINRSGKHFSTIFFFALMPARLPGLLLGKEFSTREVWSLFSGTVSFHFQKFDFCGPLFMQQNIAGSCGIMLPIKSQFWVRLGDLNISSLLLLGTDPISAFSRLAIKGQHEVFVLFEWSNLIKKADNSLESYPHQK